MKQRVADHTATDTATDRRTDNQRQSRDLLKFIYILYIYDKCETRQLFGQLFT